MSQSTQGATLTLSGGGSFEVKNIPRIPRPIPVLDSTATSTTGQRKKKPGKLEDPQSITITIFNDGTEPAKGESQTLTLTAATPEGMVSGETWVGSGFVVDVQSPEFNAESEALETKEIVFQFDGETPIVHTEPAAS